MPLTKVGALDAAVNGLAGGQGAVTVPSECVRQREAARTESSDLDVDIMARAKADGLGEVCLRMDQQDHKLGVVEVLMKWHLKVLEEPKIGVVEVVEVARKEEGYRLRQCLETGRDEDTRRPGSSLGSQVDLHHHAISNQVVRLAVVHHPKVFTINAGSARRERPSLGDSRGNGSTW